MSISHSMIDPIAIRNFGNNFYQQNGPNQHQHVGKGPENEAKIDNLVSPNFTTLFTQWEYLGRIWARIWGHWTDLISDKNSNKFQILFFHTHDNCNLLWGSWILHARPMDAHAPPMLADVSASFFCVKKEGESCGQRADPPILRRNWKGSWRPSESQIYTLE